MKKMVLMLLVTVAFAQEPIKFRGAFIGEPLSDFVDCASGKGKLLREGYKTHGKLCEGKKGIVFHTKTKGFMDPKTEGESLLFEDRNLIEIRILVPNENDRQKVRYDLIEKLGPPASELPKVYQNGFGARWEFERGFWSSGNLVVFAEIRVVTLFGSPVKRALGDAPATNGIEVTIMDAERAKLPSTSPNSMD
jgi:hypothetical protein